MKEGAVLDASGILRSDLDFTRGDYVITPSAYEEVIAEPARTVLEEAVNSGSVRVITPSKQALERVTAAATATGDLPILSKTDLDVLAAAWALGLPAITDDYAIQNTAAHLGIKCIHTSQEGIRRRFSWVWMCSGCGRETEGPGECEVCGHKARRKRRY